METATQNAAMTIIRLITNNYLQTPCSLSSSCGETQLDIALQNPLPSPTGILLLSVSLSLHPRFLPPLPSALYSICDPRCSVSITFYLLAVPLSLFFFSFFFCLLPPPRHFPAKSPTSCLFMCVARRSPPPLLSLVFLSLKD